MSDDYASHLGGFVDPSDVPALHPHVSAIHPDFSGDLYAPINYTPSGNNYTPISTTAFGKHGAQDLNARLIREQYADYQRRFQPVEDLAVNMLTPTGTKDLPFDIARTKQTVGGVFQNLQGQQNRAMSRFGQVNTADKINGGTAEAGTMVGGLNGAVLNDEDRRMKLLGGGTSTGSGALANATGGSN